MSPRTITVIGSLNIDLVTVTPRVPSGGETLTATSFSVGSGGKGANQAVACARLSRKSASPTESDITVRMVGSVGDDEFGKPLVSGLEHDGIDISKIGVEKGTNTGVAVIIVEEGDGENRILLQPGANHLLRAEDFESAESFGTPKPDLIVLQLEIPINTVLSIIDNAKKAGISVLLNPAPAVVLPASTLKDLDHLILNESEAVLLSGRDVAGAKKDDMDWGMVTDEFLQKGVRNVVITLGGEGAYISNQVGRGTMVAAEKGVRVVDTTAAGDTFVGAYAVDVVRGMAKNWDPREAVRWACKAAGRTVEKKGAQSAIPWADEVERIRY